MDAQFAGKRVLLTGHTGFKGAWLTVWLDMLGAKVCGVALEPPTEPSMFALVGGASLCARHEICDIRDSARLAKIVAAFAPQVAIHMAAQALVLPSYEEPLGTFATNVQGTAAFLDACRRIDGLESVVVVTTDKVYAHDGTPRAFVEGDRLGGDDPYSASKAAAELVVDSYRATWFARAGVPVATARAGNVIGGGDWAPHRVVPDAVRALQAGKPLVLRRPDAVRPWQHVLDPLGGYLEILRRRAGGPFNFGPEAAERRTVGELVDEFGRHFEGRPDRTIDKAEPPAEAPYLTLSASRARDELGWRPKLDFAASVARTADWVKAWRAGGDMREVTRRQIAAWTDA
jgi:CDP-glucose 4,6-dehydratase